MERGKLLMARNEKDWSQKYVAEQIGVEPITYQRWEYGKCTPQPQHLIKLSRLFGVSARELGFDNGEEEQAAVTQPSAAERDTTGDAYESVRRATLFMRLFHLVWNSSCANVHHQELQTLILLELEDNDRIMNNDDLMNRREAMRNLAMLAIEGCGLSALQPVYRRPIAEILTQCAAGITACWYLRNKGKDSAFAYDVIAKYLPTLKDIVRTGAAQQRKDAADLVVQCHLLQSALAKHFHGSDHAVMYAQQAEIYSRTAENVLLEVLSLRMQAAAFFYGNQWKQALEAGEKAKARLKTGNKTESGVAKRDTPIPLIAQSFVYAGLATYQSHEGQVQNAKDSLKKAHSTFFASPADEVVPVWIDHTQANLVLNDGKTHHHLGLYQGAYDSFQQVEGMHEEVMTRIEAIINQVMTEVYRDDRPRDMEQCIDLWTEGVKGAKVLKSKQRYQECVQAYTALRAAWPQEQRIKDLYGYLAR